MYAQSKVIVEKKSFRCFAFNLHIICIFLALRQKAGGIKHEVGNMAVYIIVILEFLKKGWNDQYLTAVSLAGSLVRTTDFLGRWRRVIRGHERIQNQINGSKVVARMSICHAISFKAVVYFSNNVS